MSNAPDPPEVVLITSWLEPHLVDEVRPADHTGRPIARSPEQEATWRRHLARATILFDFDPTHRDDLPELAPLVRWVQATSAGIGQLVRRQRYAERMPEAVFTTASGVHARPLAEFTLMSILAHARRLLPTLQAQASKKWERFAGEDLAGQTLVVVGLGAIGIEVARLARPLGLHVVGLRRRPEGRSAQDHFVDELLGPERLADVLPRAHFLVLTLPHTDETEGLIGERELASLPAGAVIINIGRGALVDEYALVSALESGHLGGAFLDVFAEEPLPSSSPLWEMANVVVSPHSASTSGGENARITDLFCDNLRRWQAGLPLLNVLDTERAY
jgi:phosphoglycerate dehydrogenase-like enzyme